MIKPHGSETLNPLYVADDAKRAALLQEAAGLPSILVSSAAAANAVMMGSGYFNPLTGFMNLEDSLAVSEKMVTTGGLFFPVPIVNVVEDAAGIQPGMRIALKDPNVDGNPVLAIQTVEAIQTATPEQMAYMTQKVFATDDPEHPGVKAFNSVGNTLISGPSSTTRTSRPTSRRPSAPPCRSARRSRRTGGTRLSPSRPATRCTAPTRSWCAWPWSARTPTAP